MLTHLPLGDSGARLQRHSLLSISMFRRFHFHFSSAGLESANATHAHHSYMSKAHERRRLPQTSSAYHFDSSSSTHLQSPRINASHQASIVCIPHGVLSVNLFFFLHVSSPQFLRPVMRRMAILGLPLHDGLYCMAWTVLAGWR